MFPCKISGGKIRDYWKKVLGTVEEVMGKWLHRLMKKGKPLESKKIYVS